MHTVHALNCPFCSRTLDEPREIQTDIGSTFTGGRCDCGAVFAYDRSGHNLGDAYVDVMAYACDFDWEKAWSLVPGEDYDIEELNHDTRRNKYTRAQKRNIPTFLFVRLKEGGEKKNKET